MTTTAALPELHIPQDVLAEVKRKSAETEFDNFRERVLEHFPDVTSVEVSLLDDPDEEDRNWVVFEVKLPEEMDVQQVRQRHTSFISALIEGRPHVEQPICSLWLRIEGEIS